MVKLLMLQLLHWRRFKIMNLFFLPRNNPVLFKPNMLIKELEDMYFSRDKKNDLNKEMPRNFKKFWQKLLRGKNKTYSRLSLSTWGYQL